MKLEFYRTPSRLPAEIGPVDVVGTFLAGRKQTTIDAYRRDLTYFAGHLGVGSIDEAARLLLSQGQGQANAIALRFRNMMIDSGLAPATCNRRLAAVRSLVKCARLMGATSITIDVGGLPAESYRDTMGPGADALRRILEHHRGLPRTEKNLRDVALLSLLAHLGLRRAEVASLDLEHVDVERGEMWVLGKGRRKRERMTLPAQTIVALRPWLGARGDFAPLFYSVSNRTKGSRLAGSSIWAIVRKMGETCGVGLWPHACRHSAITCALDSGADVRATRRFSRHANVEVLMRYDDNRQDLGGMVAGRVAAAIG